MGESNAGNRFSFSVSAKPALYRIEIIFQDGHGKRLGRYGEYLRVVRPNEDARLVVTPSSLIPGETVHARVENFGTDAVSYGEGSRIERYGDAGWESLLEPPFNPHYYLTILLKPDILDRALAILSLQIWAQAGIG